MNAPSRISLGPWVFATKTTGACLLALYVAYAFNLDQPQWTLLTVFIIAQPGRSGGILGKSQMRLIGTFVGAGVALALVGLFAQERVLFLGVLAVWIGICTFGSQLVRSWSNYAFVLSGYTAAIIGIPATLDPGNTFYLATARVTEICLGIIVGTAVSQLILPAPMAATLDDALADTRRSVSRYAAGVLNDDDVTADRAAVVGDATRIEDVLDSATFEHLPTRLARGHTRGLAAVLIDVLAAAEPLQRQLRMLASGCRHAWPSVLVGTLTNAAEAIKLWESGGLDAAALTERLRALRLDETMAADSGLPGPESRGLLAERIATFLISFAACARAWEAAMNRHPGPSPLFALDAADERLSAAMTGVRSALAVVVASLFWILTAWPHGYMATLLTALGTARAATMGRVVPLAIATTATFALAFIPSFVICEVLLPGVSGYPMFALIVAPMLFLFALLMTNRRTFVIGYMAAMLFFSASGFQNQMSYDPIAFVNTIVAGIFAASVAGLLWAMFAPETPRKQRLRFARAARKGMRRLFDTRQGAARLVGFESTVGGALVRFARTLRQDRPDDKACMEVAVTLLGSGREIASRVQVLASVSSPKAVLVAMNDCIRALSCERVDASLLRRAASELGRGVDAFAQPSSSALSDMKATADAC